MLKIPADAGKRVEDAREVAILREMRHAARAVHPASLDILVREGDALYRLYLRDEPPEQIIAGIETFRAGRGL